MKKQQEQSYVCLLRTLTRKSVFGFGYDDKKDLSMQQLLDTNCQAMMIRAYYQLSKITFTEDILNELGIIGDLRIQKPGKVEINDPIVIKAVNNYYKDKDHLKEWSKANSRKIQSKKTAKRIKGKMFSKETMRLRNHGKKVTLF